MLTSGSVFHTIMKLEQSWTATRASVNASSLMRLWLLWRRGQPLQLDLAACGGLTDLGLAQLLPAGGPALGALAAYVSGTCSSTSAMASIPADAEHGTAIAADSVPEPVQPRRLSQVCTAAALSNYERTRLKLIPMCLCSDHPVYLCSGLPPNLSFCMSFCF